MSEALEKEIESLMTLARGGAFVHASREPEGIRLSLEIRTGPARMANPVATLEAALAELQAERDEVLQELERATGEKTAIAARALQAEHARATAEAAVKRLKFRIKELEKAARKVGASEPPEDLRPDLEAARTELQGERIGRAAAEASLAMLQREHETLRGDLLNAREAEAVAAAALAESRQLSADLQAELFELWRVLRETRPGDPLAITLNVEEPLRRQNVERVQAKIIDAREIFKRRRNHRWPIAI
jgi:chromosome segregation ATPase